jgi:hypothetical protein
MFSKPVFRDDKLENLVRKCIVFPADGSETRLVHMIARTVTQEDSKITPLNIYSRCVDMTSTFGDEYRKTRVTELTAHRLGSTHDGVQITYLFFYNLSPNLPMNLNVAQLIGVTQSHLRKRLFWRGDVVAMKAQQNSECTWLVESLDADLFTLGPLKKFFQEKYQQAFFEKLLRDDEICCEQGPA